MKDEYMARMMSSAIAQSEKKRAEPLECLKSFVGYYLLKIGVGGVAQRTPHTPQHFVFWIPYWFPFHKHEFKWESCEFNPRTSKSTFINYRCKCNISVRNPYSEEAPKILTKLPN